MWRDHDYKRNISCVLEAGVQGEVDEVVIQTTCCCRTQLLRLIWVVPLPTHSTYAMRVTDTPPAGTSTRPSRHCRGSVCSSSRPPRLTVWLDTDCACTMSSTMWVTWIIDRNSIPPRLCGQLQVLQLTAVPARSTSLDRRIQADDRGDLPSGRNNCSCRAVVIIPIWDWTITSNLFRSSSRSYPNLKLRD